MVKYVITSVNNENIKQLRKCSLCFFFFFFFTFKYNFSQEMTKRWIWNLPANCDFLDQSCPLHYHHHSKSDFLWAGVWGEILVVVRLVPYQTSHLKMLAIIVKIKQILILLTQKHACLRKVSGIKQSYTVGVTGKFMS